MGGRGLAAYYRQHHLYVLAESWATIPVTVLDISLEDVWVKNSISSNQSDIRLRLKCKYAYEFEGQAYTGSRVDCGRPTDYSDKEQKMLAKHYYKILSEHKEKHEPFMAMVNPSNPEQCILFREMHARRCWVRWATLAIGLVPVIAIIYVNFIRVKKA